MFVIKISIMTVLCHHIKCIIFLWSLSSDLSRKKCSHSWVHVKYSSIAKKKGKYSFPASKQQQTRSDASVFCFLLTVVLNHSVAKDDLWVSITFRCWSILILARLNQCVWEDNTERYSWLRIKSLNYASYIQLV